MVRRRDARLEAHPVADGTGAIKGNNGLMSSCQAPAAPLASPSSVSPVRHTLNFFHICQRRLHRQCLPWSVWAPFFTSMAAIGSGCLRKAGGREKPCKSLANRCCPYSTSCEDLLSLLSSSSFRNKIVFTVVVVFGSLWKCLGKWRSPHRGHVEPTIPHQHLPLEEPRTRDLILEAGNKRLRLLWVYIGRCEDRQLRGSCVAKCRCFFVWGLSANSFRGFAR